VHWPPRDRADPETWKQVLALRDEGKVGAAGVSNYSVDQIDELTRSTGATPEVNQIRWGPSLYDGDELAEHARRGIVVEGYSPFKSTDLANPVLVEVASTYGVTPAEVVIRWHIDHGVVVIPKSATPERIAANFDVFDFSLGDDDIRRIDRLSEGGG
jgi:diketogulonate reductase-like aldo/keto reductase